VQPLEEDYEVLSAASSAAGTEKGALDRDALIAEIKKPGQPERREARA
jgi:hypothetical protein